MKMLQTEAIFWPFRPLTISPTESIMETCSVVLTFESMDEILWCDHSKKTSTAVVFHGTICFSIFFKMKFEILYEFLFLVLLRVEGLIRVAPVPQPPPPPRSTTGH